jgi:hypothetical protein
MTRRRYSSPVLQVDITQDQYDQAIQSHSGACLIADAIKAQYPHLTKVAVDMATVRATDRKRGERYIYLTPPTAQHVLLAFDQGWPNPADQLTIKGAVQIVPVTRARTGPASIAGQGEKRAARRAELEAKQAAGETLTQHERASLTRVTKPRKPAERPTTPGPAEVTRQRGREVTVRGGKPIMQGAAHPNLLRGQDRHFGAKLADPGVVFREAVDAAVAERLAAGPS